VSICSLLPVKLYHLFTVHLLQRDFRHEFMHILDLIFNGVVDGEHKANVEISRFYHRDAFSLGKLAYRTYDACKLTGQENIECKVLWLERFSA